MHAGMKTFMAGIKVGFRRSSEKEKIYKIEKGFPDMSLPVGFPKREGGLRYEKEAATQKQDLFFSASSPLFR